MFWKAFNRCRQSWGRISTSGSYAARLWHHSWPHGLGPRVSARTWILLWRHSSAWCCRAAVVHDVTLARVRTGLSLQPHSQKWGHTNRDVVTADCSVSPWQEVGDGETKVWGLLGSQVQHTCFPTWAVHPSGVKHQMPHWASFPHQIKAVWRKRAPGKERKPCKPADQPLLPSSLLGQGQELWANSLGKAGAPERTGQGDPTAQLALAGVPPGLGSSLGTVGQWREARSALPGVEEPGLGDTLDLDSGPGLTHCLRWSSQFPWDFISSYVNADTVNDEDWVGDRRCEMFSRCFLNVS